MSSETYRLVSQRNEAGEYCFDVDMPDSLRLYDLEFYARFDGVKDTSSHFSDIIVKLISPSENDIYLDSLKVNLSPNIPDGYFSASNHIPYRSGLKPVEFGLWKMRVNVVKQPEGMTGLGLICKRR